MKKYLNTYTSRLYETFLMKNCNNENMEENVKIGSTLLHLPYATDRCMWCLTRYGETSA